MTINTITITITATAATAMAHVRSDEVAAYLVAHFPSSQGSWLALSGGSFVWLWTDGSTSRITIEDADYSDLRIGVLIVLADEGDVEAQIELEYRRCQLP